MLKIITSMTLLVTFTALEMLFMLKVISAIVVGVPFAPPESTT